MRLESISIEYYRSIERLKIYFPENRPVVLLGPNNAGKSNILSAINRILGERYPTYFGKDFETYFRTTLDEYSAIEEEVINRYQISSKPGKAKAVAQNLSQVPEFIKKLCAKLEIIELLGQ